MRGADFENINMRARVAFMIACMENSVQYLELTHPRWQILIDGLWDRLSGYFFTDLEFYVCHRCSGFLELYESYSDYLQDVSPGQELFEYTEQEFNDLKEIYGIPSIPAIIIDNINYISASGIYGGHEPYEDYKAIDECIILLESHGIPLPPFENFVPFTWIQQSPHAGNYIRADFFPI